MVKKFILPGITIFALFFLLFLILSQADIVTLSFADDKKPIEDAPLPTIEQPLPEIPKPDKNDITPNPTPSQPNVADEIIRDLLILVNKQHAVTEDYVPNDLVVPNVNFSFEGMHEKKHLRKIAADALEELFQAANDQGVVLYAVSGYRSYERQQNVYNGHKQRLGEQQADSVSAKPGHSEHQTGLAMDVTSKSVNLELTEKFGDVPEGIWLAENAHKYGFIIRYQKDQEELTGYSYEPWHLRYVGKEVASSIYDQHITLETYLSENSAVSR